jgi:hypothetical protein
MRRKIDGYDQLLAQHLTADPSDHRPAPRQVKIRAAD